MKKPGDSCTHAAPNGLRWTIAALIGAILLGPALLQAKSPGYRAEIVGGTVADAPKASGRIDTSDAEALIFRAGSKQFRVKYSRIGTLEYGQNVSRRYAAAVLISPLLLLSKSRKHFVTVGFVDPEGAQQVLIFRVDKNDIRTVLASLEARSGRRVEYQDEDARKTVER